MKDVKTITLGLSSVTSDFTEILQLYSNVLAAKLRGHFDIDVRLTASELPSAKESGLQISLGVYKGTSFSTQLRFVPPATESRKLASFVQEELRKWIMLFGMPVSVMDSSPIDTKTGVLWCSAEIYTSEALERVSEKSFIDGFCDAFCSGVREYINSN